jgi:hypothetical protein
LLRALTIVDGKEFLEYILHNFFAKGRGWRPSAKTPSKGTTLSLLLFFVEAKATLDKDPLCRLKIFRELFAKGLWAFVKGFRPSAKRPHPVVLSRA